MTTRELNRDYLRLAKYRLRMSDQAFFDEGEQEFLMSELKRLYYADREFKYANKKSILIFMAMNQSLRVIPLHIVVMHDLKDIL